MGESPNGGCIANLINYYGRYMVFAKMRFSFLDDRSLLATIQLVERAAGWRADDAFQTPVYVSLTDFPHQNPSRTIIFQFPTNVKNLLLNNYKLFCYKINIIRVIDYKLKDVQFSLFIKSV